MNRTYRSGQGSRSHTSSRTQARRQLGYISLCGMVRLDAPSGVLRKAVTTDHHSAHRCSSSRQELQSRLSRRSKTHRHNTPLPGCKPLPLRKGRPHGHGRGREHGYRDRGHCWRGWHHRARGHGHDPSQLRGRRCARHLSNSQCP